MMQNHFYGLDWLTANRQLVSHAGSGSLIILDPVIARTNYTFVLFVLCLWVWVVWPEDMSHENWIAAFVFNNRARHSPVVIELYGVSFTLIVFLAFDFLVQSFPSKFVCCVAADKKSIFLNLSAASYQAGTPLSSLSTRIVHSVQW